MYPASALALAATAAAVVNRPESSTERSLDGGGGGRGAFARGPLDPRPTRFRPNAPFISPLSPRLPAGQRNSQFCRTAREEDKRIWNSSGATTSMQYLLSCMASGLTRQASLIVCLCLASQVRAIGNKERRTSAYFPTRRPTRISTRVAADCSSSCCCSRGPALGKHQRRALHQISSALVGAALTPASSAAVVRLVSSFILSLGLPPPTSRACVAAVAVASVAAPAAARAPTRPWSTHRARPFFLLLSLPPLHNHPASRLVLFRSSSLRF